MSRTRFQSSSASRRGRACSLNVRARRVRMFTRSSSLARDVELALEDVDELAPLLLRLVEIREGAERLRILAAKIEDDLPGVDRAVGLAELVGREVRDLGADLRLGDVARGVLELALVDGVELRPRTPAARRCARGPRWRPRAPCRARRRCAGTRGSRSAMSARRRLVDLAEAGVEIDELDVVGRSPCTRISRMLGELRPRLERQVDAIEVRERLGVERRRR